MKLEVDIPEELIEWLIKEVMQNYPEASTPSLHCVKYKYDDCIYTFLDEETDDDGKNIRHVVDYPKLRKGFEVLMHIALGMVPGQSFGVTGWDPQSVLCPEKAVWEDWACNWDADVLDGLVQCAIFGEVIYG